LQVIVALFWFAHHRSEPLIGDALRVFSKSTPCFLLLQDESISFFAFFFPFGGSQDFSGGFSGLFGGGRLFDWGQWRLASGRVVGQW
jgi:hypothetical protein